MSDTIEVNRYVSFGVVNAVTFKRALLTLLLVVAEMLIEVLKRGLGFFVERFWLLNGNPRRNSVSRIDLAAFALAASRLFHPGLLSRLPCCR